MNTFLIVSDTLYFINKKVNELKKDIDNIVTYNLDDYSVNDVITEASYSSLFDDKKCIIVKNTHLFSASKKDSVSKKDDCDKLLKYLENENKNTIIIFISNEKVDTKKKIYNILNDNNNVFIYNRLTKTDIKKELYNIVLDNKYNIDDNSLWYIINNVNGDLDLAINELNKLFIYYNKPCKIEYIDVVNIVSRSIVEDNFKLVDSIINKEYNKSINYINDLQLLKVDPSIIISLLYREYKLMLSVFLLNKIGKSDKDIMNYLSLASWQLDKINNNLRNYKIIEIKEEIINLSELDYKYKSGLIIKDTLLITYLMKKMS